MAGGSSLAKCSTHPPIFSGFKTAAPETIPTTPHDIDEMWEKTALKTFDPEKDQEDWPQLELKNVTVKSKEAGKRLEDLLNVRDSGPLEVRGTLSRIPDKFSGIVRTNTIYNSPLVLSNVYTYSMEKLDDGTVKIWALGLCAWYSIQPSEEYKKIFQVMIEKAKLWFFLEEKYEEYLGNDKKILGTVGQLYSKYAAKEPACATEKVAADLFDKHRRFLLLSMCSADTVMWERTPLFRHYAQEYSAELEEIQKLIILPGASATQDTSASPPPAKSRKSPPARRARKHRVKASEQASDGEETEEEINVHTSTTIRMPVTPTYGNSDSEDNGPRKRQSSKGKSSLRPSLTMPSPEAPGGAESIDDSSSSTEDTSLALPLNRKRAPDDLISFNIGTPAAKHPRTHTNSQLPISAAGISISDLIVGRHRVPSSVTSPQTVGPNRPGGHWECEIDGCKHSILDANEPENLKQIEEHYEDHGRIVEQAMKAIGGEDLPSRPKYPVK